MHHSHYTMLKTHPTNFVFIFKLLKEIIPHRCRKDLEENNDGVRVLCIEMHIRKQKWIIISIYRVPNNTNLDIFYSSISKMSNRTRVETDMIVMIGDFNIDPLK